MDEFEKPELSKTEQRWFNKVQKLIAYCVYDQSYDGSEVIWIWGDRTDMYDLFHELELPEKYWDKILANLVCPHCHSDCFELASSVGLKTKLEEETDTHIAKAQKLHGKEVVKLEKLLQDYPLLAYQNLFAKKIYKEINKKSLPTISISGNFYRARRVAGADVLDIKKMFHPPLGKSSEGRFNHAGQSHLYLSNEKETAIKEALIKDDSSLVWLQEFKIKKSISNILDLTFDWTDLSPTTSTLLLSLQLKHTLSRTDRNLDNWRPDYYLTRYIMDCAKYAGYNGIKYDSTKSYSAFNIVLFYPENEKIIAVNNPCVIIYSKEDKKFEGYPVKF